VNRYFLSIAATLIVSMLAVPTASAQDAESGMVGSWTQSIEDSDFGPTPAPDSVFMNIERADEQLVMQRHLHLSQLDGPRAVTFDMPTDGGTYDATTTDGTQAVSVSWDGSELVLVSEVEANVGSIEVIDRYRVDNDGQTLIQERMLDIPGMGVMEMTQFYTRND